MLKKVIIGLVVIISQGCLEDSTSDGTNNGPVAIFTSFDAQQGGCLQSSSGTNCNHYIDASSVYVTGGNAADGVYFFAVLTPGSQNGGFIEGAYGNLSDTTS